MKMNGFTLVEVLVVGFFVMVLYTLTTQSLFRGQRSTSLTEVSGQLVRDVRESQIRAMQGKTSSGGGLVDHSIRFEADRYILYPGLVYESGNPENQIVTLPPTMQFASINIPDQTATFGRGSGDVRNHVSGSDTITISDGAIGKTENIRINRRGGVFVSHE